MRTLSGLSPTSGSRRGGRGYTDTPSRYDAHSELADLYKGATRTMFAGLRRIMRCLVPHALAVASLAIMLGVCSPANAVARAGQGGLSRSRTIGPRVSATIRLGPRTYLVVPKNTVDQAGRISVVFLPKHAFVVDISVPWRRRVKVVAYARGRRRVELIGGILFAHDASKAIASVAGTVRGHAAISLNPLGNVCVKIGIAVGRPRSKKQGPSTQRLMEPRSPIAS